MFYKISRRIFVGANQLRTKSTFIEHSMQLEPTLSGL